MISFKNFALRRGERLLLSDVDLALHAGWRVGVVGRNGTGKSSLFAALRGEVEADRGDRSEEHTSELQSLMRTSYAVFCLKKQQGQHLHLIHGELARIDEHHPESVAVKQVPKQDKK